MTPRTAQDRPEATTTLGVLDPAFRETSWEELRRAGAEADAELDVEDVLTRRTRNSIEFWDRGVAAGRASQKQPDDESADETRLNVEDLVPVRD